MAKVFITGSTDGLGQLAAAQLLKAGHEVVLHARNKQRADALRKTMSKSCKVLVGDLSSVDQTLALASQVNDLGIFDAVIHNAGVYRASTQVIFAVNTVAPFVLTALINRPARLVYLSSGLHLQGNPDADLLTTDSGCNYSDSKLHMVMLAKTVARLWAGVYANAVNPGWVPTKMRGTGAPDDLQKGVETQVWLAVSDDPSALVSGKYFHHQRQTYTLPAAADASFQDELIAHLERLTGISFPR